MGSPATAYADQDQAPAAAAATPPAPTAGAAGAAPSTPAATSAPGGGSPAPMPIERDTSLDDLRIAGPESWGGKVYRGVLGALGGTQDVSYARGPDGKLVRTSVPSGPGQQWKRIIAGALSGFGAAATGAGTGPGATMRGAGLGVQAGMKTAQDANKQKIDQANQDYDYQLKTATSQAQNALMNHQLAASVWNLGRAKILATQQDTDRENDFAKVIADGGNGTTDLGIFPDFQSAIKATQAMPQLHDHQAGGRIVSIPHIDGNGKIDGIHAALVTPDWLSSKIMKDLPVDITSIKDGKEVHETQIIPAGSLTGDQYVKLKMGQSQDSVNRLIKDAAEKDRTSRTTAENAESYAEAAKDRADAEEKTGGENDATLTDMIGRGQMPVGRMGYLMARKPEILQAVAQKYPGFDASKAEGYTATYKDFTEGKTSVALNAGATALGHLAELRNLNTTASHIPHTPAWTRYQNKAQTVDTELANFYGDTTIPAIAGIHDTLASTLPGNRDAAIQTQAQSMGDKLDNYEQTWRNAAPSAAYEAPMPGISAAAMEARAQLDPVYKARRVAELTQGGAGVRQAPGAQPQPAPQTHSFSLSAWQAKNPQGDANAAKAAAQQQGYQVIP